MLETLNKRHAIHLDVYFLPTALCGHRLFGMAPVVPVAVVGFVEDYHHHSWCGIVLYDVPKHSPQIRQPAAELGISLL